MSFNWVKYTTSFTGFTSGASFVVGSFPALSVSANAVLVMAGAAGWPTVPPTATITFADTTTANMASLGSAQNGYWIQDARLAQGGTIRLQRVPGSSFSATHPIFAIALMVIDDVITGPVTADGYALVTSPSYANNPSATYSKTTLDATPPPLASFGFAWWDLEAVAPYTYPPLAFSFPDATWNLELNIETPPFSNAGYINRMGVGLFSMELLPPYAPHASVNNPTYGVPGSLDWQAYANCFGLVGTSVASPPPPFYSQSADQWGFAYVPGTLPSAWWQLAAVPTPPAVPDPTWISALTCDQHNPDHLYASWIHDPYVRISTDAGVTWSTSRPFPSSAAASPFPGPRVFSLQARDGQIFLFNTESADAHAGILRSTDNGVTWAQLTTTSAPGYLSLAPNKLWYAEYDTGGQVNFTRANLDGSGVEVLANIPTFGGTYLVRSLDDSLCLFTNRGAAQVYLVQSAGMSPIGPASFVPWDAVPLSPTMFVAVGTATVSSTDVLVYRTVNAGASWTLVTTIISTEGFALNGATDSYFMVDAAGPARTELVMPGNADANVQQMFWLSSDAGLTWSKILNAAESQDGSGNWLVLSPGGIVARGSRLIAIPARLATIVG